MRYHFKVTPCSAACPHKDATVIWGIFASFHGVVGPEELAALLSQFSISSVRFLKLSSLRMSGCC